MWLNTMFPFMSFNTKITKKAELFENEVEFQNVFSKLVNIYLYNIKFEGLPDTCNERFFKLNLLLNGCACLVKDEDMGFLTLGTRPSAAKYNIYGEVSEIFGFGWNGFNKTYKNYMYGSDNKDANAVVCRDNELMYPLVYTLFDYAKRLTDTMRTLDVTSKKLKTPYFITCDESQKTSIKKILDDIDFNKDSIIANRSTMPNEFNILQTGVNPQAISTLWQHYSNLQTEIRTILGINSATNLDKKERLITYEAHANDIITDMNLDIRIKNYEKFCDTVNELFGLNISVINNINILEEESEDGKEPNEIYAEPGQPDVI